MLSSGLGPVRFCPRDGLHPHLALLCPGVGGLEFSELGFTGPVGFLLSVHFTLHLPGHCFSHLVFCHFLECVHLLGQALQPVA